jgi:hypothetical protein
MGINTKETSKGAKPMAVVSTIGPMEKYTTVNGIKVSKKDTACGEESLATVISDSGKIVKQMVTESISGRMETDSKDPGKIASSTEKALIYLLTVMFIQVYTPLESQRDKECISGKMDRYTKENSKMA